VFDLDRVLRVPLRVHWLPDGVHIRSVQISCSVPTPTPNCSRSAIDLLCLILGRLTELGSDLHCHFLALFLCEQAVVRAVPTPILGIGSWVVRKSADTLVASDGGKIPPFRMNDIVDFLYRESIDGPAVSRLWTHLVVGELDSGHHDDSSVSRIPVVI
jgi:hypothetical protein